MTLTAPSPAREYLPGDVDLDGWEDLSEPAQVGVLTLRRGDLVVVLVQRHLLWDAVSVRQHRTEHAVLAPEEVAAALARM